MLNDDDGFVSSTRREDVAGRGASLCKPWGQALPFCSLTHSAIVYQAPGDTAEHKMEKKKKKTKHPCLHGIHTFLISALD